MIIEEIHRRSQVEFNQKRVSEDAKKNMAIIKDSMIHMANLAIYATFSTNGVAALHTKILKQDTFKDFYSLYPERFNNKTNGITHRRWLMYSNPKLETAITSKIGQSWKTKPEDLKKLMAFADDASFQKTIADIKYQNKVVLADVIEKMQGIRIDVHSIFDVQIKRLHAYKRQLMNVFHIMYLYHRIKTEPNFTKLTKTCTQR
jgi:starch phosphorylase